MLVLLIFFKHYSRSPLNSIAVAGVAGAQVSVAGVGGHGDAGAGLLLLVWHAAAHPPDHLR